MNENRDKRVKECISKADEGIKNIFASEAEYKSFLKVMSRFQNYSFTNSVLIATQRPSATLLAGYDDWTDNYHRKVLRGEKGIGIITPVLVSTEEDTKEKDTEGNRIVRKKSDLTFKRTYVFDISQTSGPELIIAPDELKERAKDHHYLMEALKKCTTAKIVFQPVEDDSFKGSFDMKEYKMIIRPDMSEEDTVMTLLQKVTESRIRVIGASDERQKQLEEEDRIKTESAAYLISESLGLDTSCYDFGYVVSWAGSKETEDLKKISKSIKKASVYLIRDLERELSTSLGKTLKEEEKIKQEVGAKLNLSSEEADEISVAVFDKNESAVSDTTDVFHVHVYNPNGSYNADFKLKGNEETIRGLLTDRAAEFRYLNLYLTEHGVGCSIGPYSSDKEYDYKYDYIGRNLIRTNEKEKVKNISAVVSLPKNIDEESAFRMLNSDPVAEDGNILFLNTVRNEGRDALTEDYVERLEIYRDNGYDSAWPMIDVAYSNTDKIQTKKINLYRAVNEFKNLPEEILSDRSIYLKIKISYVYNDHLYETVQNIDISTCRDNFIDYLRLPDNVITQLKRHYSIMDLCDMAEHLAPGSRYGDRYADEVQEWAEYARMELNHNSDSPVIPRPPEFDEKYTELVKDWRVER